MNPAEAETDCHEGRKWSFKKRVGTLGAQSLMTAMRTPVMVTNVPIIQRK